MSWTKRQFVNQAFSMIGYADYDYDLQPEQLQNALYILDSMLSTWNAKMVSLAYPVPGSPEDSDLDDESNVPDRANEAIYLNLALKIASSLGKTVSPDLKASAWYAYNNLLSWALSNPRKMSMPDTMPRGAGNKPWRFNSDEYLEQTADPYPPWGET
jgi:hypothetical protein